ncbi:TSUP family transporter [Maritalea mediterranea]|uniref:Probable membrane transporter protein n=1 Tax=Maritalea mediterranea TaxID=2909667 RepID=A0ABS9E4N3_9HYPH|nr:TSUP family transporter [Maritalea mediterranea]MCF4097757.1 TSUP family transporter [Maritalea mediterranea]
MEFEITLLVMMAGVGFVAGFMDAIAGGGGLLSVPALLFAGLPPVGALATNKMQSVVGAIVAATTYARKGFVDFKQLGVAIISTFIGAVIGAFAATRMDADFLLLLVPILLIGVAAYFLLSPRLSDDARAERLSFTLFAPLMGFIIGFYDGIFGPGTGSFFTAGFVTLFGFGITRAVGSTKVLNATSNAAALMFFIFAGEVIWIIGAAMIVGQIGGGYLGAITGMRFGARLIKPLIVIISIAMALRLLWPQLIVLLNGGNGL